MSFHSSGDRRHIRPLTGQSSWSLKACRIGHIAAFWSRLRVGSLIVTTKPSSADLTASCALARASLCDSTKVRFCIECLHDFQRRGPDGNRAAGRDYIGKTGGVDLDDAAARGHLAQAVAHLQRCELGGKDYLLDRAPAGAGQVKPDFAGVVHRFFPKRAMLNTQDREDHTSALYRLEHRRRLLEKPGVIDPERVRDPVQGRFHAGNASVQVAPASVRWPEIELKRQP